MKTLVTFDEVKFIENPEKKTVVCIMRCVINKYKHPTHYKVFISNFEDTHPWATEQNDVIHFRVVGKAQCYPNDRFDASLGRKIAESRAKAKAFDKAFQYWDYVSKKMKSLLSDCVIQKDICNSASIKEEEHVSDLIYDNNN